MNERVLGRTGLKVSELSLGGLFVSKLGAQFDEARRAVHRAVDLGVNYIDTAPGYLDSEEVLGKILPEIKRPLILSTKLGGRPWPFNPQDRKALEASVEESLRLLKRDVIDILMIHEPDRPGQWDWFTDTESFTGPVTELLDDLKRKGKIRFTGLGGTTAYEMAHLIRTGRFDVVLTAFNYSLLWREAEIDILPAAREQNVGIIIGSPLQQGALAKRYDEQVNDPSKSRWLSPPRRAQFKALYKLLDETRFNLPELALRFVLSNPDVACVLSGARSEAEVQANVAAAEKGPLPAELMKKLDEIAKMVPFRPYAEPFSSPFVWGDYKGPGPAQ
jgi:D-threo-aldose 1-dehydrogenase